METITAKEVASSLYSDCVDGKSPHERGDSCKNRVGGIKNGRKSGARVVHAERVAKPGDTSMLDCLKRMAEKVGDISSAITNDSSGMMETTV